jgi:glycosyltransferase involved in cell wall biosynthesis
MMETGGWGGIHYYAHALCARLVECSVDLTLVTNQEYELEELPRPFKRLSFFRRESYLRSIWRLKEIFCRERPDILHLQSLISQRKDLALLLLCRWMGIRVVMTVHNILPHEVRPFERYLYFLYYRLADRLIIHSQHNCDALLEAFPTLEAQKIKVIAHGNYELFRSWEMPQAKARQRLGLPADCTIVLFFGAIRPYKGLDLLLQAIRPVRHACPNAFFVVAGHVHTGTLATYQAQIEDLDLKTEDLLTCFEYLSTSDAIAYVCAADLVVMPYRHIYQSGVVFWAYSFGRPVVAARVGSLPETVVDGISGWLVDKEDVDGLSNTMIKVISQPDLLETAGKNARQLADDQYDWADIAVETAALYDELTNGQSV